MERPPFETVKNRPPFHNTERIFVNNNDFFQQPFLIHYQQTGLFFYYIIRLLQSPLYSLW